ncbi:hypothetical protein HDU98_003247 [Podochytrium sp. JEL0797]|nr:hypothetical protein HDU98_003247 [Podochytrium sp. JEL0797]
MNQPDPLPCLCGKVAGLSRSALCRNCKVRFHLRCISKEPNVPYICRKCAPNVTPRPTNPKVAMKAPKFAMKAPRTAMKSPRVQLPVAALIEDDDDDLCPVCDGDCTCNTPIKPPPPLFTPSFKNSLPLVPTPKILEPLQKPRPVSSNPKKPPPSATPSKPPLKFETPKPTRHEPSSKPVAKQSEVRRMVVSISDLVLDSDGNAWKAKTPLKRAGPREFGKMTHLPHADVLRNAPRMEKIGANWIVQEVRTPVPAPHPPATTVPVAAKPKKNLLFDSSSDGSDSEPLMQQRHAKLAGNSGQAKHAAVRSSSSSSDLDSDGAVIYFTDESDLDASPGLRDDEPEDALLAEMVGPPFVEQHTTTDDSDSDDLDASESGSEASSLSDFLDENSDDMAIDMIFAGAGTTDDGTDASESDIDMFVANALYGGWSSDEFEFSDEDSILGVEESDDESSVAPFALSEDVSLPTTPLRPAVLYSASSTPEPSTLDFGYLSEDIHTLDPAVNDPSFGVSATVITSTPAPKPVVNFEPSISPLTPASKLPPTSEATPTASTPVPKPLVNFDIKQTHIGPNGELVTTTKQLSLPVQKPKAEKKKKPKLANLKTSELVAGPTPPAAGKPNESVSQAQSAPPSSVAVLKAALSGLLSSAGSGSASQKTPQQLVATLVSSLKTLGGGASTANALSSLLKSQKGGEASVSKSATATTEAGTATSSATNIAALAVIAAAFAAAKGRLNPNKKEPAGSTSAQDAIVSKALEDFLATALPALSTLQKQQQQQSSGSDASKTTSSTKEESRDEDMITLEDLFDFDTEALDSFSDTAPGESYDGVEELDLSDPFSRWTKVPVGTFRKYRRPSLNRVVKNDFKKAFRYSKHSPSMTLPSSPFVTDYIMGGGSSSGGPNPWRSPKIQSAELESNALVFPNIPPFPSPVLPPSSRPQQKDIPGLALPSGDPFDPFYGGFEAQTGFTQWKKTAK